MSFISLSSVRVRRILWQLLAVAALASLCGWLAHNALVNLEVRRVGTGFDFLSRPANIPIGESLLDYEPGWPVYLAILVGLLNTILVSVIGILLATIVGTAVGVSRLSGNPLLSGLARIYVEFVRNVPLLAHLFLIYVILQGLPPLRSALSVGGVIFLSNRGLVAPLVSTEHALLPISVALAAGLGTGILLSRRAVRIQAATGHRPPVLAWVLAVVVGCFGIGGYLAGITVSISLPRLKGLNFVGGQTLSPELTALVLGLTLYFSAFIAEIVRGGILAVPKGQWEAASALGLRRRQIFSLIVLPQALRVIVPPTTNQYLDLAKTSSLAIAIGFPDLVAVVNGVITDTGQAIECVAIIMAAFLLINLAISVPMNVLNARLKLGRR
jgi:general L-amino acid transport system permease protein